MLNIGLRCNFDVGDGVISRFGIDTESPEFEQALQLIRENPALQLVNLHCHFAKRQVEYWPARAKGMLQLADRVAEVLGYLPKRIDLGGGIFGKMPTSLKKQFSPTFRIIRPMPRRRPFRVRSISGAWTLLPNCWWSPALHWQATA